MSDVRQSNFELLRIVAMLMVVFLHANQLSIGVVDRQELLTSPGCAFLRLAMHQVCAICINLFILISGYFSIKASVKGLGNILFQAYFYSFVIIACFYCFNNTINPNLILKTLLFGSVYWFLPEYIILFLFSPVLNIFAEHADRKMFKCVLLSFFLVELLLGWFWQYSTFEGGYSALHFFGIYLLGRYLRLHKPSFLQHTNKRNAVLYIVFTIIPVLGTAASLYFKDSQYGQHVYTSPFVIAASVYFFCFFRNLQFSSRMINFLASSCFSIYLIHCHPLIFPQFTKLINRIDADTNGIVSILIVFFGGVLFCLLCMLIDKIRMSVWKFICTLSNKYLCAHFT